MVLSLLYHILTLIHKDIRGILHLIKASIPNINCSLSYESLTTSGSFSQQTFYINSLLLPTRIQQNYQELKYNTHCAISADFVQYNSQGPIYISTIHNVITVICFVNNRAKGGSKGTILLLVSTIDSSPMPQCTDSVTL